MKIRSRKIESKTKLKHISLISLLVFTTKKGRNHSTHSTQQVNHLLYVT